MSGEPSTRTGRSGGIFVAVVVAGSAIGVIGWYLITNRHGAAIDESGFDLSATPQTARPVPVASAAASPAEPVSSLGMLKADAGVSIVDSNAAAPAGKPAQKASSPKEQAGMSFTEAVRKHESEVHRFMIRMTNKYPVVRQYGRDWMSHPDLKRLNDQFMRDHDPIAFMKGLAKAPSLGVMMKSYAGRPEMRDVVMQSMKQAPSDLTSSAMEVLQNEGVVKNLVANIASGMGLPPSVTAMINGGGGSDPSKIDQKAIMGDVMNSPEMQKAMRQQGEQAPAVSLPGQR